MNLKNSFNKQPLLILDGWINVFYGKLKLFIQLIHFVLIVQTATHLRMIITVKFTNDFNVIWEKHGFTKFLIKNKTIQILFR